jgi:hypothetical protein
MKRNHEPLVFGISIGLAIGVAMGAALNSIALGVALGMAFGVVFAATRGTASDAPLARKNAAAQKPLPDPLGLFTR